MFGWCWLNYFIEFFLMWFWYYVIFIFNKLKWEEFRILILVVIKKIWIIILFKYESKMKKIFGGWF